MSAVEEFDIDEASDDDGAAPVRSPRRRRSHPGGWALAALTLVGIGSAVADPIPAMVHGGSGTQAGLLDVNVHLPPTIAWEISAEYADVLGIEGSLAVLIADDGFTRDMIGIDLETGAEMWRYEDSSATCQWNETLVCVEQPGDPDAAIVEIDIEDGAHSLSPYPGAAAAVRTGDALIVVEATDSATEEVVLLEADGTERWRVRADAAELETDPVWVQLQVTDTAVVLQFSGTEIELSSGEVQAVTTWTVGDGVEVQVGENGPVVSTPDGRVELETDEIWLAYDDDVGGPLVVHQRPPGTIEVTQRADGIQVWQSPSEDCYPAARLRGVLVSQCWDSAGIHLVGLSLLTGDELWEHAGWLTAASATAVLVVDDTQQALTAVDALTGSEHWAIDTGAGFYGVAASTPDGILLSTDTSLTRLRWD